MSRLDEFAASPFNSTFRAADIIRYLTIGFDIVPTAPSTVGFRFFSNASLVLQDKNANIILQDKSGSLVLQ